MERVKSPGLNCYLLATVLAVLGVQGYYVWDYSSLKKPLTVFTVSCQNEVGPNTDLSGGHSCFSSLFPPTFS